MKMFYKASNCCVCYNLVFESVQSGYARRFYAVCTLMPQFICEVSESNSTEIYNQLILNYREIENFKRFINRSQLLK